MVGRKKEAGSKKEKEEKEREDIMWDRERKTKYQI